MADSKSSSGISFVSLLLLAFIILKLCHVIAWKWIWVFAPMWIPLGIAALCGIGLLVLKLTDKKKGRP